MWYGGGGVGLARSSCLDNTKVVEMMWNGGWVAQDLSSQNILLQSSPEYSSSFRAKVADFGLARIVKHQERICSNSYGTVTHVAPEVLTDGLLSPVPCPLPSPLPACASHVLASPCIVDG